MLKNAKKMLAVAISVVMLAGCGAAKPAETGKEAPAETKQEEPKKEEPKKEEAKAEEPKKEEAAASGEVSEYSFLMCWNGGAGSFPEGFQDSEIMKTLIAKTGVKLKVETISSSEREKLAMIFASGDIPDITDAPHWNTNPGGEGELIKNAGVEGLLLPLKGKIEKYPNIKKLYNVGTLSQQYLDNHIYNKEYNGDFYIIPTQTGASPDDTWNWAYNLFAREDILKKLNIAPESVTTAEGVHDLLKKIKDGGFVDTNGKPVIPAGAWGNGWSFGEYIQSYNIGGATGWDLIDGKFVNAVFNDLEVEKYKFMRKLVAEGLMDPESFTQTDTMAKEKMVTGRVATFGCHYPNAYGFFNSTLYKTNPEMKFVPLGPILNSKGEQNTSNEKIGRNGSPGLFFSKDVKDPDKLFGMLDYINSEEGILLTKFGIEGKTYTMVNGIPTYTEEANKIRTTENETWNKMGFAFGGSFRGADPSVSRGWDPSYSEEGYVKAREIRPLKFIEYTTMDDIVNDWPGKKAYDEKMSTTNYGDELKKACLAQSDDEVVAIIEAQRKRMIDAGLEDMVKYVTERYAADNKILY